MAVRIITINTSWNILWINFVGDEFAAKVDS